MLFLLFSVYDKHFAMDISLVEEVIPTVSLENINNAPEYVRGLLPYRGSTIPIVDMCQLIMGKPCVGALSTRIIVIHYPGGKGDNQYIGLLAEHVTETADEEEILFSGEMSHGERGSYLEALGSSDDGLVHRIDLSRLLPVFIKQYICERNEIEKER